MYMVSNQRRDQINKYLEELESVRAKLDKIAESWECSGYLLAASLVRDGREYLDDITWLDFTADVEEAEDPDVDNVLIS